MSLLRTIFGRAAHHRARCAVHLRSACSSRHRHRRRHCRCELGLPSATRQASGGTSCRHITPSAVVLTPSAVARQGMCDSARQINPVSGCASFIVYTHTHTHTHTHTRARARAARLVDLTVYGLVGDSMRLATRNCSDQTSATPKQHAAHGLRACEC
jgi:hypothetical protein